MNKKTKNFMIYSVGGIALLVFTYGLALLRSMNGSRGPSKENLQYSRRM